MNCRNEMKMNQRQWLHSHVVQGQSSQVNTLNKARYRKAAYSALWV